MRWHDILTLEKKDWGIFSAPQYFQDRLYDFRKFSYMALVHLTTFTDHQNFFQVPPKNVSENWRQRAKDSFQRERTPSAHRFQKWSVAWCVPNSIFAIVAAVGFAVLALHGLLFPQRAFVPPSSIVLVLLAWGFYSPIYFSLHRVGDPYTAGYWLPRLVLPALISFFVLGYAVIDFVVLRLGRFPVLAKGLSWVVLAHTAVACAIFVAFLT
jgi:hypothetical protein